MCDTRYLCNDENPVPVLKILNADEWQGLFANGELKTENHELRLSEVAKAMGFSITHEDPLMELLHLKGYKVSQDWVEDLKNPQKDQIEKELELGGFPEKYEN